MAQIWQDERVYIHGVGVDKLSFEQAKAIYELRRKKVRLHSIESLEKLKCFTPTELERLAPYLQFETNE